MNSERSRSQVNGAASMHHSIVGMSVPCVNCHGGAVQCSGSVLNKPPPVGMVVHFVSPRSAFRLDFRVARLVGQGLQAHPHLRELLRHQVPLTVVAGLARTHGVGPGELASSASRNDVIQRQQLWRELLQAVLVTTYRAKEEDGR